MEDPCSGLLFGALDCGLRFLCLSPALAMNLFCVLGTKSKILLGVYKYMGNLVLSTELK